VAALPQAQAFSDAREGRAATVYRVRSDSADYALKVFKTGYASKEPEGTRDVMARLSIIPGLIAASHTAIEKPQHDPLLDSHPDLEHAHLMPWVEGPTWQSFIVDRRPLAVEDALSIARSLASTFAQLESLGMAHCDLSGGNVLLPMFTDGKGYKWPAELVDLDQLYHSGLAKPIQLTLGSPGYQLLPSSRDWSPLADRYSGGVLLAEILSWPDEAVRAASGAEGYYDPSSRRAESDRRRIQIEGFRRIYGHSGVTTLLETLLAGQTLEQCPTLSEWHRAISDLGAKAEDQKESVTESPAKARLATGKTASSQPQAPGLPTWEYGLGSSRNQRLAEGAIAFVVVAAAACGLVALGLSDVVSLTGVLRDAGGAALARMPGGLGAGLMVGAAEALLFRRTFSGYAAGAFLVSSVIGGGLGAFAGGLSLDQLHCGVLWGGVVAGAIAGSIAAAVQATQLVRGSQLLWVSYHLVGWSAIWGVAWAIDFSGGLSMAVAAAVLVLGSGMLTVLATQGIRELEF
jgi:hypothetical protein